MLPYLLSSKLTLLIALSSQFLGSLGHTNRTIPGGPYQEDHYQEDQTPGGPNTRRITMLHKNPNTYNDELSRISHRF